MIRIGRASPAGSGARQRFAIRSGRHRHARRLAHVGIGRQPQEELSTSLLPSRHRKWPRAGGRSWPAVAAHGAADSPRLFVCAKSDVLYIRCEGVRSSVEVMRFCSGDHSGARACWPVRGRVAIRCTATLSAAGRSGRAAAARRPARRVAGADPATAGRAPSAVHPRGGAYWPTICACNQGPRARQRPGGRLPRSPAAAGADPRRAPGGALDGDRLTRVGKSAPRSWRIRRPCWRATARRRAEVPAITTVDQRRWPSHRLQGGSARHCRGGLSCL
jgi:hypothetical protein